ncbi:hypothetical protein ACJ41O_010446 [Fusarium nematophilum]
MKPLWALSLGLLVGAAAVVVLDESTPPEGAIFKPARASGPTGGTVIDRSNWKVTCDSDEYQVGEDHRCSRAIDGDPDTFWHTVFVHSSPKLPHTITVDMKAVQNVIGISVLPRQDGASSGWIAQHRVFLSIGGKKWGSPVATGTWYADETKKFANFEVKRARYVRLVALTEANNRRYASIAELNVYKAAAYLPPKPGLGRWGPTLNFPVIPVAGAVDPASGNVIVWSADRYDRYSGNGRTQTAAWDPAMNIITQREVTETGHDMFCPGTSMDADGQIVVTGGGDAQSTSLYDPVSGRWIKGPDMKIARGYQSSATTSDGRVFTIGGSWSGGEFEKNGEIYDPASHTWALLPNASVHPMLTADREGILRSDNHAWLFGWKSGTVFQAGPSTAMNWYYTKNSKGAVRPAGKRRSSRGIDPDAMCGNAVMYDALNGKILTFGGAPNFIDDDATANAHIITLGSPGKRPQVEFASDGMWYPRIFHTSVVLPDGSIFITGGQSHGIPFTDSTPQLTPELYRPETDTFILQQTNSIVRTYHTISLLLPDGRVFNGGGGLCAECGTNHFDAQIFTPGYLYRENGMQTKRPKITWSPDTISVGGSTAIRTNAPVSSASLIRYGTATHGINTDQRRIPLTLERASTNKYSFSLPDDAGIALPGYWMLFVMDSTGVPSIAATIKVVL